MKALFQRNGAWADIMEACPVRPVEVDVITRMLACGTPLMGSREFHFSQTLVSRFMGRSKNTSGAVIAHSCKV
uniref:hypothetical protein n=1 Tax=Yersinia frederiksenii TaxID=29484 RepID=UPI001F4BDBA7|nr:hypothetical protein [Yersinia frederiksenii]